MMGARTNTTTLSPLETANIVHACAIAFGVRDIDILTKSRSRTISAARSAAAFLMRERGLSYPEISREVGYRDHSSAMASCTKIKETIWRTEQVSWAADQLGGRPCTDDDRLLAARVETARRMSK